MKTWITCTLALLPFLSMTATEAPNALKVKGQQLFTTPLEWVGVDAPPEAESSRLLDAISVFETSGTKGGYQALEGFLKANPHSAWSPALRAHLAETYRNNGRYSLALSHWNAAWESTKAGNDATSKK